MKEGKLTGIQRTLIALAAIALIAVVWLPVWRIELSAPQYPEGLVMKIYANKLGGDVSIVNGLNHYIGMRTLHADDFPEFTFLPWIIGFFALLSLVVSLTARRRLLLVLTGLYLLFAVLAMVDFWRWEYSYGHQLNPEAPIQVPGMTYQPPLIGYKQLLNFGAYSIPDTGGWLMAAAGLLFLICIFMRSKLLKAHNTQTGLFLFLFTFTISGCTVGPRPIKPGVDNCDYCRMTITDLRFGGEILSKKGKVWKFDDIHCLLSFLKSDRMQKVQVKEIYFLNFSARRDDLLPAGKASLLYSDNLNSPMNGNIAAFDNHSDLLSAIKTLGGREISWNELYR